METEVLFQEEQKFPALKKVEGQP